MADWCTGLLCKQERGLHVRSMCVNARVDLICSGEANHEVECLTVEQEEMLLMDL